MMKKFLSIFAVVALVAGFVMMAPTASAAAASGAQAAGSSVVTGLTQLFSGNLALAAGLALAFFGFWMWAVQQQSWGLVILICGVILTAFPGIFEAMTQGVEGIAGTFTGASGDSTLTGRVDTIN